MRAESNGRLTVVQVVNGFGIGGGEKKLLELIRRLDRSRFRNVVVSVGQSGPLEDEFREAAEGTYILPKKRALDLSLPKKLAEVARSERADLMMTTLFYADVVGAASTYFYKPKGLVSWEVITQPLGPKHKLAYRLLAQRFDVVVAVSNSIWPMILNDRSQRREQVRTIYYGVDLDVFRPGARPELRREWFGEDDVLVFGTVARLTVQKGHTYLLDALPKILSELPKARFVFVGDGPLRPSLEEEAERLGVAHAVKFLGSRSDVPELLHGFDVFVLPSLWEGLPNVVLEAMATGLPVVATAVEGTVEAVVNGETGILVPSKQPEPLAEAILRIGRDADLRSRMGSASRRRVEENFSLDGQVRAFEELYSELAARA